MLTNKKYFSLFSLCFLILAASTSVTLSFIVESGNEAPQLNKLHSSIKEQIKEIDHDEPITVVIKLMDVDLRNVESGMVIDVLKAHASSSQEFVLKFLSEEKGAVVLNTFWLTDIILANVTVDTLYRLTSLEVVAEIFENFEVTVPEPLNRSDVTSNGVTWGLDRINATEVWALGFNGSGIRVCVLDTGVEISHPDLQGKMWTDNSSDPTFPGGWIEFDSSGNIVAGSTPHDTDGHGTHTSGTVLGGNASGTAIGVAPGAWLMHGLILPGGSGSFTQCIAGMQWAIDPFDQYGNPAGERADVVSMSWGAYGYYDEMIEPIENMRAAGVIPVAAIGNGGEGSSVSPGNVYESFGIGATDSYDSVAYFSSGEEVDWAASHPTVYIKPDFSAPGVSVYSSVPSGGWESWSGTSMATPHVAGTVALMLQANSGMTVDDIYDLLKITADDLGDAGLDTRYGWGIINAYEAVRLALFSCGVEGYVTDAETSQPIEWGAQVTVLGVSWGSQNTSTGGFYKIWLYPGNYSLTAMSFGYYEQNTTAEVIDQQWTVLNFSLTPTPRGFVAGVVTSVDTNSTIANATVTLLGTPLKPAVTNAVGYYVIEAPVGVYDVDGWAWGYKPSVAYGTRVFENQTTTVNLQLNSTIKVAILGDFRSQVTNLLMRNISAHERDWNITQDIYEYDVVIVNIPSDPGNQTFMDLIDAADQYQVGLIFTNTWPAPWWPYGISLLHNYLDDPRGSYYVYWTGSVYYEVTVNHPIFEGWNVGDKIYIIKGGDDDCAWFYRYSGVTIADIGSDSLGLQGHGIAYTIRSNGSVHLLLAGLSQSSYTNIRNAWTEEAKTIFRRAVMWASEPVMLTPPSISISVSPNSGPVGTKVTVNGSGFALDSQVTVKFDDTPMATTKTDANGSFVAVFNVPTAETGTHLIKALDESGNYANATYTITWVPTGEVTLLAVEVDVGLVHFRGEVAEFYVLTAINGVPVNVTSISVEIHKPDRTTEVLTAERKATGLYLITYTIPTDAPTGTYTLTVEANVDGVNGASLGSFLVSPTLADWNAVLVAIENSIATIQTDVNTIKMNLTSVDAEISAVQGDIVIIRTDIGEIKADVAYVRSVIENTSATLVAIQGDVAVVKTDIGEIRGLITSIQGDVATIETDLGQMKVALPSSGGNSGMQYISAAGLSVSSFFSGIAATAAIIAVMLLWSSSTVRPKMREKPMEVLKPDPEPPTKEVKKRLKTRTKPKRKMKPKRITRTKTKTETRKKAKTKAKVRGRRK
jgi:subtilisin family serine protease